MLVSVIVPFYSKQPGLLKRSVISALSQSYGNIEVVVVDDASPVSAKDDLASVDDPRIRIVVHEQNRNGAQARNTGIREARGELVAFLDFDDEWATNKIEVQVRIYKESLSLYGEKIAIYSQCLIVEGHRRFIRPKRALGFNEQVSDYLFINNGLIQTSGLLLSKKNALSVGFDNLPRHQDYQFCLSLEDFGVKFFMAPAPLYKFIQIPKMNNPDYSFWWINEYRNFFTEKAFVGFMRKVVIRSLIKGDRMAEAYRLSRSYSSFLFFAFESVKLKIKYILYKV